jgi:signal transduction histidine kinase
MGVARYLPRSRVDVVVAMVGLGLVVAVCWAPPNPVGDPVAGSALLLALYSVLLSVPLAWRRHSPFAAFTLIMAAVLLQAVVTGDSSEGLHNIYSVGIATFAVAVYCERRRSTAALVIAMAVYGVYALENRDIQSGRAADQWAGSFFGVALVTVWLVGVFVRDRRLERLAAEHALAVERAAQEAVTVERARLARELHDVISHNLSVIVVQAAGARAAGSSTPEALEKIESSGRESLVEMRRLLGVLRHDGEDASLSPQPGIAAVGELVEQVCAAGVPIELAVDGDVEGLAPAVDLSVYRIVQEALTNVLKHAGHARARVAVTCLPDAVTVDITDDGCGPTATIAVGHGLIGMRERVAMFGGDFEAGPGRDGGFVVHARVPRRARTP